MRYNLVCSMYVVFFWYVLCNILYIYDIIIFFFICLYNGYMYFYILGKIVIGILVIYEFYDE